MDELDEEALELSGANVGLSTVEVEAEELAFAEDTSAYLDPNAQKAVQDISQTVDTRETLESLKQSALQRRAVDLGATAEEVEAAIDDDANPKGALIDLILSRQAVEPQVAIVEGESVAAEQAVEDIYQLATEEGAFDAVDEAEEQAYYSIAASVDADEEEEEEEEEDGEGDQVLEEVAGDAKDQGQLDNEEDDDDDVMFFEDVGSVAAASPDDASAGVAMTQLSADEADDMDMDEPAQVALCAQCGLPGHATSQCPFGHPEDIELGDMDESDSDNELPTKHPMLARYISQHTGALHPKHKKGLTGEKRYFGEDKAKQCWVCGRTDHDSNDCPRKCCFFCGQQGHDGKECAERSSICTHCRCKGHIPVSCPTMASKAIVSFASAHCMRCGDLGHVNCGLPPLAPQLKAAPPPFQQSLPTFLGGPPLCTPFPGASNGPLFFNAGLPPPTPSSPPSPSGGPPLPVPTESFRLVKPRPPSSPPPNGSGLSGLVKPRPPSIPPPNGSGLSPLAALPGEVRPRLPNGSDLSPLAALPPGVPAKSSDGDSEAPFSKSAQSASPDLQTSGKSSQIAGRSDVRVDAKIVKVPGKAPIAKVPGKAAIAKVPGKAAIAKVSGKASITKVPGKAHIVKTPGKAPITKVPAKAKQELMKASAKKSSKASGPPPKKQKTW